MTKEKGFQKDSDESAHYISSKEASVFFRGWWHSARLILLWHQTQVWSAIFNSYTTCIWGCTNRGVGLVLVHMNLREHGKIAGMPWRTPVFCGRWWCFEGNTSPGAWGFPAPKPLAQLQWSSRRGVACHGASISHWHLRCGFDAVGRAVATKAVEFWIWVATAGSV